MGRSMFMHFPVTFQTLHKPVGYECEFVDQVHEDYFCKMCDHVAREPNITTCCGEVLCKACVDSIVQDKKPCPSCERNDIKALGLHVKYQRKILALEVCCTMKDRGCEWTGQLQHLDGHLDVTTGDCQYVDVECPNKCGQKVQKRNVDIHLANECPNRDYECPQCNFKATFSVVSDHFEVCPYYKMVQAATLRISQDFERKLQEQQEVFEKKLQEQQKMFEKKLEIKFAKDQETDVCQIKAEK